MKIFNDGYLGSHDDEERSEMRYAMRIAEFLESSDFRTQPAPIWGIYSRYRYVCFSIQNITKLNMIDKTHLRVNGVFHQVRISSYFRPMKQSLFSDLIGNDLMSLQTTNFLPFTSEIKQDNPLNLSISLSGGKENNSDYLSSGERSGNSPILNPIPGIVI